MGTIRVSNVSVDIPVYDMAGASLRTMLLGKTVGGRFAKSGGHVIVHALKNISFEAFDGDRIGLIGFNGSGKTTLLRVLSDVYPPSAGTLEINGRVSPMLDATLGMAGDATGLENIRMCGVLWGLTRSQIEASLDDIAEFTELGEYLKMPVRTYSAGMMLRLAFAIATLREPDILLLDEVIGVGDASFYQKAYARLQNMVQRSRILFVASHATPIIRQLCNKAIWLHQGGLVRYGEVSEVLTAYEKGDSSN
ncbi:MAG TPA: ABC transporter ATP-binding protein [Gammaproteobacteria bacterium]|nr:ABC transporter ATP-binding protein [Gammaproteobacteria bacterium]